MVYCISILLFFLNGASAQDSSESPLDEVKVLLQTMKQSKEAPLLPPLLQSCDGSSHPSPSGESPFCERPYETICGNDPVTRNPFQERIQKTLHVLESKSAPLQKLTQTRRKLRDEFEFHGQTYRNQVKDILPGVHELFLPVSLYLEKEARLNEAFEKSKSGLQEVLRQMKIKKQITEEDDELFQGFFAGVSLWDAQKIKSLLAEDSGETHKHALKALEYDFVEENVPYFNSFEDQFYVHVPPVFLASLLSSPGWTEKDLESLLLSVLVHELSHSIVPDLNLFHPGFFKAFETCLQENFPLKGSVATELNEAEADWMSIQSLATRLSGDLSDAEKIRTLRASFQLFCGTAEGDHPSDRYRIEVLVRRNPEIHRVMGCKAREKGKPGCTLDGPTPEKLF